MLKKGSQNCLPERCLSWCDSKFKCLGIVFSLNTNAMFDLNYRIKLKQIEVILNIWRARNLSLIDKICVIKSLLLPQLIYLFFSFVNEDPLPLTLRNWTDYYTILFGTVVEIETREKSCVMILNLVVYV